MQNEDLKLKFLAPIIIIIVTLILIFFWFKSDFFKSNLKISGDFVVKITDNGYDPNEITIPLNGRITFINEGKESHWPASNIHPTHGIYPEFDPKQPIKPGGLWEFRFNKVGSWKYHDHLTPFIRGTIVVKQ